MLAQIRRLFTLHCYALLILGGALDAMTTWVSVGVMSGTEIAPVMAYAFMAMGIIPALFLKMAITAEGGRVLLQYSPSLVTVLAVAFWLIGLSNLAGVGLMVAVEMGFYA